MSCQNNWTNIPPEILDEILGHCDPSSLLTLSQVNHQLNFLALNQYFSQRITGNVLQLPSKPSLESLFNKHSEPGRALRCAFWLPKMIQHIDYRLAPNAKYNWYINDLCDLTAFIYRMPKLVSLRINSGYISDGEVINEQFHCDVWARLLAAAVLKGCEVLEVKEKDIVINGQLFSPPGPYEGLRSSILRSRSWIFRNLSRVSTPKRATTLLKRTVKPFLREIRINGYSFRNSVFLFHTILTQYATSITRLSLMNLGIWDSEKLKKLFDRIHFAALESFAFNNGWPIAPTTFLTFLSRHPTLICLDLYVDFWMISPKKWSTWRRPPKFPNLQNLRLVPEALQWLVPDFRRCPKLRFIELKCDTGLIEEGLGPCKWHTTVQSILNNLHAFSSMTWPIKLEMGLPLCDSAWLSNLRSGGGGETHSGWSRVKELRLKDIRTPDFDSTISDVLIDWLLAFPSLEHLEVESSARVFGKELAESLTASCPNFKSLGVTCHPFHTSDKRWKTWVVEDGRVILPVTD